LLCVMKTALVLLAIVICAYASKRDFADFQRKYNKIYKTTEEFNKRYQIFQDNMKWAAELNQLNPMATFGVNKFADLSREEFAKFYLMANYTRMNPRPAPVAPFVVKPRGPDPTNWDWQNYSPSCITPVYDQGQCGSCWAFSATETIESYYALAGNGIRRLSMEQIVDCDTAGNDQGCNGGFPSGAYSYVQSAGGIDSYSSYPYTAGGGQASSCAFQSNSVVTTVGGYNSVSGETGLYAQVSTNGPVSVCVDASSWQTYNGGILTSCGNNIDHCVQLTGYQSYDPTSQNPNSAWNVRNSWSTSWGQNGYILIQTGSDLCAIGDEATIVSTSQP